ncbi:MAG: GspE/PulE family protein [Candidatus Sumerlaeota bacterium]|nr:GspE/PulE family protein [Candidatus Sumerlaeota bacterium]
MAGNTDQQLGQALVRDGFLEPANLDSAIREAHSTGEMLSQVLVRLAMVSEDDVQLALADLLHYPFLRPSEMEIPKEVIAMAPAQIVTRYKVIPIERSNGSLKVAMVDPMDMHTIDDLRLALRMEIEPVVSTHTEINEAIKKYYGIGAETMERMMDTKEESEAVPVIDSTVSDVGEESMAEDASIVRFVNQIISESITERATDIHVEPLEKSLRIRYRIDGVLSEVAVPPAIKQFQSAIISRIKIMADMNIAERRLPQDGKIKIKKGVREFDLRVSSIPTPYGESIAIRLLSRDEDLVNILALGFDAANLEILRDLITRPHGILLVSGPTGSGKSTTLYAALKEINKIDYKIFTVEDPIEYRMEGITQVQVNPSIGLTFANILRTLLRQDPDIIMVGEIRDEETAQISIRAALTGHLVFSTIHTNDACGSVTRLLDMNIEPFLVSSSVNGILAQRLVRTLCTCKQPFQAPPGVVERVNLTKDDMAKQTIYRAAGCDRCRFTGYRGRTAIYEIVKMDEQLRRLVVERQSAYELKRYAVGQGMRPLRLLGWEKIKEGRTTIDEVLRVTMEDEHGVV